jgi:hypothetical protein
MNTLIVASCERSSMASTWRVYLCVTPLANGRAFLDIRQYEALAEYSGEDEDGNEIPLPRKINDQIVVGVEDEWIVGGDLEAYESAKLEYGITDLDQAEAWSTAQGFKIGEQEKKIISAAIKED